MRSEHTRTPLNKFFESALRAVQDVHDGATILVGGFGISGQPLGLLDALAEQGAKDLTLVSNNSGRLETGMGRLMRLGRVRKLIASFPRGAEAVAFDELFAAGAIEFECVPQGTLAERLRAAGAGLGGFFTPTAYGTDLAAGKKTRIIEGRGYVFEKPLHGDFAFVKVHHADRWGNLTYRKAARNFGPVMCMAAKTTVAQVHSMVELGALDPEQVVSPGILIQRVVEITDAQQPGVVQ